MEKFMFKKLLLLIDENTCPEYYTFLECYYLIKTNEFSNALELANKLKYKTIDLLSKCIINAIIADLYSQTDYLRAMSTLKEIYNSLLNDKEWDYDNYTLLKFIRYFISKELSLRTENNDMLKAKEYMDQAIKDWDYLYRSVPITRCLKYDF